MNRRLGFFGKSPQRGDYVDRNLSSAFISGWDAWLQSAMKGSRDVLQDGWLEAYLQSPIWRFILDRGTLTKTPWAGVILPSVDRVGRYYPMTFAVPIDDLERPLMAMFTMREWFEGLEVIALRVLDDQTSFKEWEKMIEDYGALPLYGALSEETKDANESAPRGIIRLVSSSPHSLGIEMSWGEEAVPFFAGGSLWSTLGSQRVSPQCLSFEGLPPPSFFHRLLEQDDGPLLSRYRWQATPVGSSARSLWGLGAADTLDQSSDRRWYSSSLTDSGGREVNEDASLMQPAKGLWVIADGMGGHTAGDIASQKVVASLSALPQGISWAAKLGAIQRALHEANRTIQAYARMEKRGAMMGSTVVALVIEEEQGVVFWAGDSRLYQSRGGSLRQLTEDHSLASVTKAITDDDREAPPTASSNIITRAVGATPDLMLDTHWFDIKPGDRYLLTTDGIHKAMEPHEILSLMEAPGSPEQRISQIMRLAKTRDGRDNLSLILIEEWGRG